MFANIVGCNGKGRDMQIALAAFTLRAGVSEEALLIASDDFERSFVKEQDGILRRILVRDGEGGYADIVFFEDAAALDRVVEAEQSSEACAGFFAIMEDDGAHRVYEMLKTYER